MDYQVIQTFISAVGFPIACVCYLFWAQNKERELHKEESEKWCAALNNNTLVLQKLLDKLDSQAHD